jgi:hypothetical protein
MVKGSEGCTCGLAVVTLLLGMGCGMDSGIGKLYPVAGQITLDGKPLAGETVRVLFKPDAAKGNTTAFEPVGIVDGQGGYTLITQGKEGAPPGWYKVVVVATADRPPRPATGQGRRPVALQSLLPAKYGTAETTDLAVEVVENPPSGAFDLPLVGSAR